MPDLKISALPRKSALAVNDLIPIVDLQFGAPNYVNKKTTIGDIVTLVSTSVAAGSALASLGDTTIVTPAQGDILRYDSATNKWVNIPFIVDGKISADYLPSYVDDVVEYASLSAFPEIGESGKIYVALDTHYIYRWSGSLYVEIGPLDRELAWGNVQVSTNFRVLGVSQGSYADGDEITAGTSIETVIKKMLQVRVPPTYSQPALSIATQNALIYEYGAPISITLNLNWTKNDAGEAIQFTYLAGGDALHVIQGSAPVAYTYTAPALTAPITFTGAVLHQAGAIKSDNFGDPAPAGAILAGTKASGNSVSVVPRHRRYWGVSANPQITDSEIFTLNSELASSRTQIRNDFAPVNQYIYIAYPASFGHATIKFNGYVATNAWPLTTRNVTNVNGYVEPYYIYRTQYTQNSPDIDVEVL